MGVICFRAMRIITLEPRELSLWSHENYHFRAMGIITATEAINWTKGDQSLQMQYTVSGI